MNIAELSLAGKCPQQQPEAVNPYLVCPLLHLVPACLDVIQQTLEEPVLCAQHEHAIIATEQQLDALVVYISWALLPAQQTQSVVKYRLTGFAMVAHTCCSRVITFFLPLCSCSSCASVSCMRLHGMNVGRQSRQAEYQEYMRYSDYLDTTLGGTHFLLDVQQVLALSVIKAAACILTVTRISDSLDFCGTYLSR
jgi:hypothetical protein